MKKLMLILLMLLFVPLANATTYYVRTDGGTSAQCNGLVDAPYTASTSNLVQGCAYNHPFWVITPKGQNQKMVGGDILIIGPGQYKMGLDAPNAVSSSCYSAWSYDCVANPIPSGTSTNPTKILGKGWDTLVGVKPQLWANERPWQILDLRGSSNVQIQYLDITDHSSCIENGPDAATKCKRDAPPFGPWGATGIIASDSSNVLLKNLDIHGLSKGIQAARLTNWTLENVNIIANSFVGWDGDLGATTSSNSGKITFKDSKIQWSGCGETYPLTDSNLSSSKDKHHCYSQDQGGYGDGLGTNTTDGDWVFDHVNFSNNVSDGLDLLYHTAVGSITILNNSVFEGNAGNQVKVAGKTNLDASTLTGTCDSFAGKPYTATTAVTGGNVAFNNCRAGGSIFANRLLPGSKTSITKSKLLHNIYIAIESSGSTCNGSESISVDENTTFENLPMYSRPDQTSVEYYASGATGNGDGTCGTIKLTKSATTPVCTPISGSCNAATPACGATTTGVDNCGAVCTKTGPACCVSDPNSCNAPVPACNTTTTGVDNCGIACNKVGAVCCVSNGSCNASTPTCGQTTVGVDNCGNACSLIGPACCVSNGSCSAVAPNCGQTTVGVDNCGNACSKTGAPCACVSDLTTCNAAQPAVGKANLGYDNCGKACYKTAFTTTVNSYVTPVKVTTK